MTYIKASEEVIDAAVEFVKTHENLYRCWIGREGQEDFCKEFKRLCAAVLSGPAKARDDRAMQSDGVSGVRGEVVLQSAPPADTQRAHDPVDHPAHYNSGRIEVIEAIEDWGLGFADGNAVKYVARAGKKDSAKRIEDLKKASWYLAREIERLSR